MKLFYKDLSNMPLFLISTFVFVHAQGPPDTLWTKIYGNEHSIGYSLVHTPDMGFFIVGETRNSGADVYLIKTDSLGEVLETRMYGGEHYDRAFSISQTSSGGYIIVGESWQRRLHSDLFLIKTDENGDSLWTRLIGGDQNETGYAVRETADSGYIMTGTTHSFGAGNADVYLVKTDVHGNVRWMRTYGGPDWDIGYDVRQTDDGGFIIVGSTYQDSSFYDVWLIRTDSLGDTLWTKTYGSSASTDVGYCLEETTDNSFIIAGYTGRIGASSVLVIKTDAFGDTLWVRAFICGVNDCAHSIIETSDNEYLITGQTFSIHPTQTQVLLLKLNVNGDSIWTKTIRHTNHQRNSGRDAIQMDDNSYAIVGTSYPSGSGEFIFLIKLASEEGVVENNIKLIDNNDFHATIFGGPLLLPEGKNCRVFDITGRVVTPDKIKPGIYFVEIDGVISHKVIKIK